MRLEGIIAANIMYRGSMDLESCIAGEIYGGDGQSLDVCIPRFCLSFPLDIFVMISDVEIKSWARGPQRLLTDRMATYVRQEDSQICRGRRKLHGVWALYSWFSDSDRVKRRSLIYYYRVASSRPARSLPEKS